MFPTTILKVLLFVFAALSFATREARAYLDPGTGSYVVQVLIASLAGGTYLLISSWGRVKEFVRGLRDRLAKRRR